jgi:hypothetical protein
MGSHMHVGSISALASELVVQTIFANRPNNIFCSNPNNKLVLPAIRVVGSTSSEARAEMGSHMHVGSILALASELIVQTIFANRPNNIFCSNLNQKLVLPAIRVVGSTSSEARAEMGSHMHVGANSALDE